MRILHGGKTGFEQSEYLVCIFAGRSKKLKIGISESRNVLSGTADRNFPKLVYYEKFRERKIALRRKRLLLNLGKEKLISVITKNNPEWLNLIFSFYEEGKV